MQKPKYHENEIFSTEFAFEITKVEDNITESATDVTDANFKVEDKVNIKDLEKIDINLKIYTLKGL